MDILDIYAKVELVHAIDAGEWRYAEPYLWIAFFLIAFIIALIRLLMGDTEVFKTMMDGVFDSANTGVQISIGLIGIMSLFLGFMNIGERAGAIGFWGESKF